MIGTGRVKNTDYTKVVTFDTTSIVFYLIPKLAKRYYSTHILKEQFYLGAVSNMRPFAQYGTICTI